MWCVGVVCCFFDGGQLRESLVLGMVMSCVILCVLVGMGVCVVNARSGGWYVGCEAVGRQKGWGVGVEWGLAFPLEAFVASGAGKG